MTSKKKATPGKAGSWETIRTKADYRGERHAVYLGHAQKVLKGLPDGSVHTALTSPPYWSARDYGHSNQIGLEDDLDGYIETLRAVFRELYRVLTPDGTFWLNVGDSYLHYTTHPKRREAWKRNKQLALIPFRLAMALQEDGWILRNTAVWHKPNAMPSSVRDRLTNTWEPVFLFAKTDRYTFNLDAIRIPHKTDDAIERNRAEKGAAKGKAQGDQELRRWLNSPRHRSSIDGLKEVRRRPNAPRATELATYLKNALAAKGLSITWVADQLGLPFERTRHYFRTDEIGSRLPPEETWEKLKDLLDLDTEFDDCMEVEVGDNVFRNHPLGKNPGDMASVALAGGAAAGNHFAVMPRGLADWALKATLPPGGICIDPFMGSGTTGLSAITLGGKFIGIDLKADYVSHFLEKMRK